MPFSHSFHPTSLREYDIRGVVGKTLTPEDGFAIGPDLRQHHRPIRGEYRRRWLRWPHPLP